MATGNQMLPTAQVTTERVVTAQQQMTAGRCTGKAGWPAEAIWYASGELAVQPQRTSRRGTGGRWLAWVLRAVVRLRGSVHRAARWALIRQFDRNLGSAGRVVVNGSRRARPAQDRSKPRSPIPES
jgi:hypothetical protein